MPWGGKEERIMPADIVAIIQTAISPLIAKIQSLEEKVDRLNQDRVTRSDVENLRKELLGTMVPRDSYEPRHAMLIERDTQLELAIRDNRKEVDADLKELEKRIEVNKELIDEKIKEKSTADLSKEDRHWMRLTQIVAYVSLLVAIAEFAVQYVHFGK